MAEKKTPNVVLFPGAAPSMQHLIDDAAEECPNPTAAVVVFIDGENDAQVTIRHYCNRMELAIIAARLLYLAGRNAELTS